MMMLSLALSIPLVSPGQAASAQLLKDGQMIELDFESGPSSKVRGKRGMGKFRQGPLDEAAGTFFPAKVLKHTATELRFKGKSDDCILRIDHTVTCKSGSAGTWRP
jgi:hypothetical protein